MHDNAYGYGHEWGRGMEEEFVMDMSSYILTNYRLRKKDPLIALGSHKTGGPEFLRPRYPTAGSRERLCLVQNKNKKLLFDALPRFL